MGRHKFYFGKVGRLEPPNVNSPSFYITPPQNLKAVSKRANGTFGSKNFGRSEPINVNPPSVYITPPYSTNLVLHTPVGRQPQEIESAKSFNDQALRYQPS